MKKLLKNRVLPIVCAVSILASVCSVSAFSAFDPGFADTGSVMEWESEINSPGASLVDVIAQRLGVGAVYTETFWGFVDACVTPVGSVSQGDLEGLCSKFNATFNRPVGESFFSQLFEGSADIYSNTISALYLGNMNLHFEIQQHPASGFYRIKETTTDIWVVNSVGYYPYYESIGDGETEAGDQWIGETTAQDRSTSGTVAIHTLDRINLICNRLKNEGLSVKLKTLNDASGKPKYQGIWYNRQFYADPNGNPYVAPYNSNEWASNQDRPDTSVTDENGVEIDGLPEDNVTNIDFSGMTITLPDGSINMIDQIYYDESTKTYHVDSHDTYNTEYNFYYEWTYHINYTSITYIGQTEEYNKYYEVYYELPDGRDSADLSKEELEQLALSIDVQTYDRASDDASLRSLYHFDGDTDDSSFWNYCTDFTWNTGASLTYMDAGVFNGALYLDESVHDFTMTLPSNITSGPFTFQFRYYQSHTLAPQTDSYILFGDQKILQLDGANLYKGSGGSLADYDTGVWNEICIRRSDAGTIAYYLNGVRIGTVSDTTAFTDTITFHFGSAQQTYKYLDEVRFVNRSLYPLAGYTPTSVPFDSNLALVLPGSQTGVADEYWEITTDPDAVSSLNLTTGTQPSNITTFSSITYNSTGSGNLDKYCEYPQWAVYNNSSYNTISFLDGYTTLTHKQSFKFYGNDDYIDTRYQYCDGLFTRIGYTYSSTDYALLEDGDYVLSVVLDDGTVSQWAFTWDSSQDCSASQEFSWGTMWIDYQAYSSKQQNTVLFITPTAGTSVNLMYVELTPGTEADVSCEWVESVVVMEEEDLHTPTLAIQTDLEITSTQFGGVRPSLPEPGMVWALIENERITSLQIYTGQAWEAVDGRIWTGSRWIPYSSYNVITLQDMYDVVDATPNYEYIYSEAGFWSWWQKSWNAFTEKLFAALASGGGVSSGSSGGAGSSVMDDVDLDAEDTVADPDQEDSKSLWQFVVLVISGGKSVVGGVRHMFSGIVSVVPDTMNDLTDALDPGGMAVGFMDGSSLDPDAADLYDSNEIELAGNEEVDPWRYR